MGSLHSQHYLHIKAALIFFYHDALIFPLISRSSGPSRFIQSRVRSTRSTSFFIDAVQSLDDRGRGQIFISFTFRFSGPSDSLINSQIMRLNVSSPRLDWFGTFFFRPLCVNAVEGSGDTPIESNLDGPRFLVI